MLLDSRTGIRHLNSSQFLCGEEYHVLIVFIFKHCTELFVLLYIDGAETMGTGEDSAISKSLGNLVVNGFVLLGMMSQSETDSSHHRNIMQFE